jgi:hypothetical protein
MRDFFYGWRRKAGVVTLVMACALTGAWLRSETEFHCFTLPANSWAHVTLVSERGSVRLVKMDAVHSLSSARWWYGTLPEIADPSDYLEGGGIEVDWRWDLGGFTIAYYHVTEQPEIGHTAECKLPYWSIVLCVTLLSAYLILWKPRKR